MDYEAYKEELRARTPMLSLLERDGLAMRRSGSRWVGLCPFHVEKHGSFGVDNSRPEWAHCFGCGWSGDVFKYWMDRRGCDFKTAVGELAQIAGMAPMQENLKWEKLKTEIKKAEPEEIKLPALPPLRGLRDDEIEMIAATRGLSVASVRIAARTFKRIGYADWPKWESRGGRWTSPCQAHFFKCNFETPECSPRESWPSWIITDVTRRVGEFRRLDNLPYPRLKHDAIKAWSTAGKSWPVGAAEMEHRLNVLLVEGGPDVLAAYHFLHGFGMLGSVAVVGMLGGSNRIAEDALMHFRGRRVRIMMDADEVKELTTTLADGTTRTRASRAGLSAALRWQEQLTAAGAAVECYDLTGLMRADGRPVKDVNDLALANAETVGSDEVVEAFMEWNF